MTQGSARDRVEHRAVRHRIRRAGRGSRGQRFLNALKIRNLFADIGKMMLCGLFHFFSGGGRSRSPGPKDRKCPPS